MSDELVELANYGSRLEADLVVQRLHNANIQAARASDGAGGTLPALASATGGYRVMVRADDVDAASELLEAPDEEATAEADGTG